MTERIKSALRLVGSEHQPQPDWQRRVHCRIDRQQFVRDGIAVLIILAAVALLIGISR